MSTPTGHHTAKNWDKVRTEFHTSIMVDTSLNSLAQNLDGGGLAAPGGGRDAREVHRPQFG